MDSALVTGSSHAEAAPTVIGALHARSTARININVFTVVGGNNFVLREVVVGGQSSAALQISPSTTLTLVGPEISGQSAAGTSQIASAQTQTVTVTSTPSSAAVNTAKHYTAGDLAGAAAGSGVPLLLGLLGTLFVIFRLRHDLRRQKLRPTPSSNGYAAVASQGYEQKPSVYYASEPQQRSVFQSPGPVEASSERELREI
ncbi:hypothetical protein LTR56_012327 [Elasticomyces elasticus]|nr:hypothetical protein LTR56_012327 [Elasticomyces elasticus]KAK3641283.1 hypothetical protein LTR22_016651 [Elasticomyces elasticus]KAK4922612.1 hypothetical protein LTR49_010139 [Elasticomyces elasticus]KAK5760785.1 hypothetical protein LTS12_009143 [Elasticomyces elasticus]